MLISYRRLWVLIPVALGMTFLLWTTLFAIMGVKGRSMSPSLFAGDKVLVFRWAYGLRMPGGRAASVSWGNVRKGHIVAIDLGSDGPVAVKRVLATPGDSISIAHGRLRTGAVTLILAENQFASLAGIGEVPPGQLLVIGDYGPESYDSRHYGLVPVSALRGRILGAWRKPSKPKAL